MIAYIFLHLRAPYTHPTRKKGLHQKCNPLNLLVRPAGFEPAAYGFVVRRSIRAELRAHYNSDKIRIC